MTTLIPFGYCQCGCGNKTAIAKKNNKEWGHVKGQPVRFICGHHGKGSGNGMYKGGLCFDKHSNRYRVDRGDGVFMTRARKIMQDHLNRPLTANEVVHHLNGDPHDDRLENLEVLSRAEHMRLHRVGGHGTRAGG